jgi:hypothetical protein
VDFTEGTQKTAAGIQLKINLWHHPFKTIV